MQDTNLQQSVIDHIKKASNVLVTVSSSPSVDELAAALGLTLLLDVNEKHATAVVSGDIPNALVFLHPEQTFENSVSSLRDFIISLDKNKADKLSYKVEGDVVKIRITPYKQAITEADLEYSEGDYNVDLLIALGVERKDDLDKAIVSHGRILHDATVISLAAGTKGNASLGDVSWTDNSASGLSEMVLEIAEGLKKGSLNEQIANALLTGLVAATDRFSNAATSARVMTMAAQLMAAGANQQLIATELSKAHAIGNNVEPAVEPTGIAPPVEVSKAADETKEMKVDQNDGALSIDHSAEAPPITQELPKPEPTAQPPARTEPPKPTKGETAPKKTRITKVKAQDWGHPKATDDEAPVFGGTLNATTAEVEAAKRREAEADAKKGTLSHDEPISTGGKDIKSRGLPPVEQTAPPEGVPQWIATAKQNLGEPLPAPVETTPAHAPTLSEIEAHAKATKETTAEQPASSNVDEARAAVEAALSGDGDAPTVVAEPAQEFKPTLTEPRPTPATIIPPATPTTTPLAPPPLPPMPDFSTLPPLPTPSVDLSTPLPASEQAPSPPVPPEPGQFRIPGQ